MVTDRLRAQAVPHPPASAPNKCPIAIGVPRFLNKIIIKYIINNNLMINVIILFYGFYP